MNRALLSETATEDHTDAEAGAGEAAPDRLIRLPEVMARVGLRRTAIYQRMREGRFPQSRSLGPRCTVWLEAEIDRWIEQVCSRE
ncbi:MULTISPECIES: helix-turn-helix transcriptional regulator [Sphingomonadales]|jgi:prophage regulatory protein|uniref:AlpA family transcriptional regulator n=1 Tax=Alteriqipengyuania abyssalis TaxID=2860200 RepID=A0ABS7P972_9SPHN|nr:MULTISPECIES: AlpA family transcriptional regulator [Sphingomonadales]MBY8335614.1 AlpA family transcriptional regulator [Alteriqipengyuania abyssalis]